MTTTLYIFIDESGNESRGDYYVVSSCWCASTSRNFTDVLDPTVQRLTNIAEGTLYDSDPISELKGAELPTEVINAVITSFDSVCYDDSTIPHSSIPWGNSYPIRFSMSAANPEVGTEAISSFVRNDLDAPKTMKLFMLISVLDPLFRDTIVNTGEIDDVKIILDATVWDNPAEYAQDAFDDLGDLSADVSFSTEDSARTPGLQLADMAAYSWGRHHREGDCETTLEVIDRYCFAEV